VCVGEMTPEFLEENVDGEAFVPDSHLVVVVDNFFLGHGSV